MITASGPALRQQLIDAGILRERAALPPGAIALDELGLNYAARDIFREYGAPRWLLEQADPRIARRIEARAGRLAA